jgi:hypothetical protein
MMPSGIWRVTAETKGMRRARALSLENMMLERLREL